jgi:hypothetical protein
MIYVFGNEGNMGRRYTAILNHIGIVAEGCDKSYPHNLFGRLKAADGVIIATPTFTHLDVIRMLLAYEKPILCEKPLSLNFDALEHFDRVHPEAKQLVTMVNQYEYLATDSVSEMTFYNYFKTGGDGLYWDCLNIIGLAKGWAQIHNDSPIWKCVINGQILSIKDMDQAYISMIKRWVDMIGRRRTNWAYAIEAHRKVNRLVG